MNRYNRSQVEQTLRTFRARLAVAKEHTPMNIADGTQCARFVAMLEKAEAADKRGHLPGIESAFVNDMRARFETREDALDMGMTPWSPTLKQWNWLHNIVSML